MNVLDNKCPTCGAKIEFNPKNQLWDCSYCGNKFTLEEMRQYNNASSDKVNNGKPFFKKLDDKDVYRCKNCGAEVIADETVTATFCVYCGSTAILKDKITDGVAPSMLIPFKKVKEDAILAFKNLSKGRPLMPNLFNREENVKKISGVYIPFWIYDLKVSGNVDFTATDIITWSDYNYRYVKTNIYSAKRDGSMQFNKVSVDGSSRFDDDLMDSIEPFDYNDLVSYNHAYLSGFLAEKYDVDDDVALERANVRVMNSAVDVISDTVGHQSKVVSSNNLKVDRIKTDYILLPVFMVNINYKNKLYTFAMNGQTGKIVGNIPLDIGKTILFSMIIFVVVAILIFIILGMVR